MTDRPEDAPEDAEYVEDDIAIANLKLDELNFRTDEVDSQRAAIRAMIDEQGTGLVDLAEHYLRYGRLTPGERLLVIPDDEEGENDFFVVMEGNRRLTVMKLLEEPSLAANTEIHARFVELARQAARRPRRTLPCVILPDRETALVWVEVKHSTGLRGAGVEKWSAPATARFREFRGEMVRWRSALRFLDDQSVDTTDIRTGISDVTTAVTRVLHAGAMREVLGVRFRSDDTIEFENGDVVAGTRLLTAIMQAMAAPTFNTNRVHAFEDRVAFITGFSPLAVKAPPTGNGSTAQSGGINGGEGARGARGSQQNGEGDGGGNGGGDGEEGETSGTGASRRRSGVCRHPRERGTLASKKHSDALHIADNRLNQLYIEARKLKVDSHTAIAAVLIRVFLELSCEYYLSSNKIPLPADIARRGGGRPVTWHSFEIKLREKIENAVNSLDPQRTLPDFAEIRRGLGSQDHLHSPAHLNDYVHGLRTIPSARDLIIIWDRYHPLFAHIFA